jgi:hypothetical protein
MTTGSHAIPQLVMAQLALDPPYRVVDGGNAILLGHGNGGVLGSNLSSLSLVHLLDHHSQEVQNFVVIHHLCLPNPDADVVQCRMVVAMMMILAAWKWARIIRRIGNFRFHMANMFSLMVVRMAERRRELIQRIVQLLPIVVGLDEHRRDVVGGVPCDEVEPRLCPSLQIRLDFGPGPDTCVMGPARPVTVKVANQKLVIADNLKHF